MNSVDDLTEEHLGFAGLVYEHVLVRKLRFHGTYSIAMKSSLGISDVKMVLVSTGSGTGTRTDNTPCVYKYSVNIVTHHIKPRQWSESLKLYTNAI
jgi:hypothetical protein